MIGSGQLATLKQAKSDPVPVLPTSTLGNIIGKLCNIIQVAGWVIPAASKGESRRARGLLVAASASVTRRSRHYFLRSLMSPCPFVFQRSYLALNYR